VCYLLLAGFLFGSFFDPEDGDDNTTRIYRVSASN
jgi:hypothetical protein